MFCRTNADARATYRLKFEPVDAAHIVREVVAEAYTDFEEHGIELEVLIGGGDSLCSLKNTAKITKA